MEAELLGRDYRRMVDWARAVPGLSQVSFWNVEEKEMGSIIKLVKKELGDIKILFGGVNFDRVPEDVIVPCVRLRGRGTTKNRWGYFARYDMTIDEDIISVLSKGYVSIRIEKDNVKDVSEWEKFLKRVCLVYDLVLREIDYDVWIENFVFKGHVLRFCGAGRNKVAIDENGETWPCRKLVGRDIFSYCKCSENCLNVCLGEIPEKCVLIKIERDVAREWFVYLTKRIYERRDKNPDVVRRIGTVLGLPQKEIQARIEYCR
uniref:Uncharacterized protein n=1 Tax=candidate division CPR3 bacterium TaxID=2268181 RepID=A0A7V3J9I1_UNCC3